MGRQHGGPRYVGSTGLIDGSLWYNVVGLLSSLCSCKSLLANYFNVVSILECKEYNEY